MKKIAIICPHPTNVAPGQRLKYEQYFDHFRQHGYQIDVYPFMTDKFWEIVYQEGKFFQKIYYTLVGYAKRIALLPKLRKYDVCYVFLWVTPFGFPVFEALLHKSCNGFIYDIDDLVFHKDHKSKQNSLIASLKGRKKPFYLMKKAKHVITCTPYLDEFVRQFNQNTTDISSTINTDAYIPVNPYSNDAPLVIGWSGSHSTSKYVHLLKEVLQSVSAKYAVVIHVIGDVHFQIDGLENIKTIPWSEATEVAELQKIDIGIYPLPNEEWVMGKSGLKALQYMALGIPTIATAIGANFRVIEDGVSGTLVTTPEEWEQALIRYIENPELRRAHGTEARKRVETYYSIKANAPTYLSILDQTAAK